MACHNAVITTFEDDLVKKIATLAIMAATALSLSGCVETSDGEKIGIITKLAKQGVIVKTWEGEIIRGGFSNGSGANGQAFHFTIEDDAVAKQLLTAMENQQEVKITYKTEMFHFLRSESEGHFLKTVTAITPKKDDAPAGTSASTGNRREDKIIELLKVQAKLIEELAK